MSPRIYVVYHVVVISLLRELLLRKRFLLLFFKGIDIFSKSGTLFINRK